MDSKSVLVESSNIAESGPVIIDPKKVKQQIASKSSDEYLDEYDNYYFDNEKYFNAGHGGKQRNKKEVELNSQRVDPSGNVRIIVSKMQNFEHNRRKSSSSSSQ